MKILHKSTLSSRAVKKHANHNQQTHAGRNHPRHGGGGKGAFEALPQRLNSASRKIDEEFKRTKNMAAANDLARAKTHIWSAGKATSAKTAAAPILSAQLSISNASRKLSRTDTPASIRLQDLSTEMEALYNVLSGPEGG